MASLTSPDAMAVSVDRGYWGSPVEFVLSCIGYSVGLGNVWRFPYLCYKNGGAAFLLVYVFLQFTVGKPLYFMELAMAQYSGKGPVRVWDLNPAARGIGLSMCIVSVNVGLYYNVIIAYIMHYFFASFTRHLPWNECDESWPEDCFVKSGDSEAQKQCLKPKASVSQMLNTTCICTSDPDIDKYYNCSDPQIPSTQLYFEKVVIQESDDLTNFGYPSMKLSSLLFVSWFVVLACMIKGIQSTGKVVYFTATFPYVILLILLGKGATLDGALDGIKFFIVPKWTELQKLQLWIDAAGQMFFSLSLSMGGIIMFGSYNKFGHNVYRDAFIISFMDLITSVLAGFVIFTTLGYMAKQTGTGISKVAQSGYGLAFVAYPETLTTLDWPNFWSLLFFFMLFILGLDSEFALIETVVTCLIDDIRWCRRHNTILRLMFGVILYFLGLFLVCPGGQYLIAILDMYGTAYPLGLISLLECVSVMWVYGVQNFLNDVDYMLGKKPPVLAYWYTVWVVWCPLFLFGLLIATLSRAEIPKFNNGEHYGPGVMAGCWILYSVTLSPILLWFCLHTRVTYRQHGFTDFQAFMKKLMAAGPRFGPADGLHPRATRRGTTVWADVLDWKIFGARTRQPEGPATEELAVATAGVTEQQQTVHAHLQEDIPAADRREENTMVEGVGEGETRPSPPASLPPTDADRKLSHAVD